ARCSFSSESDSVVSSKEACRFVLIACVVSETYAITPGAGGSRALFDPNTSRAHLAQCKTSLKIRACSEQLFSHRWTAHLCVSQAGIQAMKPSIARASCTKAESAGLRPDSRAVARSNSFSRAPPPGSTGKLTYAPELLPPNLLLKPRGRRSKGRETRSLLILL